jgi:hypothetical protein
MSVRVEITYAPVNMSDRGGGGRGENGLGTLSLMSYTLRYVSLTDLDRL